MTNKPEKKKGGRLRPLRVYVFDKDKNPVCQYESVSEAARELNIRSGTIFSAIYMRRLCDGQWYYSQTEKLEDEVTYGINVQSSRRIKRFFKDLDNKEE